MYAPSCSLVGGKSIPKFGPCLSFQQIEIEWFNIFKSWWVIDVRPTKLFDHPRLRDLLFLRPNWQIHTYIGMFGAPTWKPVRLVSSHEAVEGLVRTIHFMSMKQTTMLDNYMRICLHAKIYLPAHAGHWIDPNLRNRSQPSSIGKMAGSVSRVLAKSWKTPKYILQPLVVKPFDCKSNLGSTLVWFFFWHAPGIPN